MTVISGNIPAPPVSEPAPAGPEPKLLTLDAAVRRGIRRLTRPGWHRRGVLDLFFWIDHRQRRCCLPWGRHQRVVDGEWKKWMVFLAALPRDGWCEWSDAAQEQAQSEGVGI